MKRREFIALLAGGAAGWPRDAIAQLAAKVRRIGVLLLASQCPPPIALLESLGALGWIEGKTVALDCVSALGRIEDIPTLAADLVARHPDVIASGFVPCIEALKAATNNIPIVMLNVADPVRFGLIDSLSRPGGNVTGLATALGELDGKRIALLKEVVPNITRLAILAGSQGPVAAPSYFDAVRKSLIDAGGLYGFSHEWFYFSSRESLSPLLAEIAGNKFDAIYLVPSALVEAPAGLISQLAQSVRLPTVGWLASQAKSGMLLSYGPNTERNAHRAAVYIDKILKGAKPADLPVEQPTEFDLAINLKTAKALGLTVPPSLLARADELIE